MSIPPLPPLLRGDAAATLLSWLQEDVHVFDAGGHILYFNHEDPAQPVVGLHCRALVEGLEAFAADGQTPLPPSELGPERGLRGLETADRLILVRSADAPDRWLRIRGFPLLDAGGRIEGAVSLGLDVTAERELRAQLQRQQVVGARGGNPGGELFHVGRLGVTGEVASAMAHQINQPLSAITLYARALRRRLDEQPGIPADILEALEGISDQALRAGDLVRDMRRFARGATMSAEPVSARALLEATRPLLEHEAKRHAARLELELPGELPWLRADIAQLQQVLLNLVRNAFEAIGSLGDGAPPPDRAAVVVRARQSAPGQLEFTVRDRGPGLPEGETRAWFEAFTSSREGANGLGLPISRGIVENHGGQLWLRANEDGPGTTAGFTLPAGQPAGEE